GKWRIRKGSRDGTSFGKRAGGNTPRYAGTLPLRHSDRHRRTEPSNWYKTEKARSRGMGRRRWRSIPSHCRTFAAGRLPGSLLLSRSRKSDPNSENQNCPIAGLDRRRDGTAARLEAPGHAIWHTVPL